MKLGPHAILTTDASLRWARRAPIVKAVDRLKSLEEANPKAMLVYRKYWHNQADVLRRGGAWAAAIVCSEVSSLPDSVKDRLYLEGMNETSQRLGQGLEEYVVWQQDFSDYCHHQGYRVVGFSFSTGNPEPEDWRHIQEHDFGGCDYLGLHQYWGAEGFSIWNALRHRMVHGWLDGAHPPMIITECGRDKIEGNEGGYLASYPGVEDEEKERRFLAELLAYDRQIADDPYILGATPFTSGPTPDWEAFNMDKISDRIEGGDLPMPPEQTLAEQFPVLFSQWVELGGDAEGSFRHHLLGIGALSSTSQAFSILCEDAKSLSEQIKQVGLRLPKA